MESYAIKELTFAYPNRNAYALRNLSFTVEAGQFIALCGASGCGKTTLLRHLKPAITPHGVKSGEILFENNPVESLDLRDTSSKIGFVMQSPDNQIVTDKVWHELAFGMESLGFNKPTIRRRVAEMASFFGIQTWFHKSVTELSGGQKQLLNLAGIMTMQPSVLILDEPTSQLDPIAAAEFLDVVGKINRELGTTIILTEHRLEEVFPHADRVLVMENGGIICDGTPADVGMELRGKEHGMFAAMPVPMRVYAATESSADCPVTVRDGRNWLSEQEIKNDLAANDRPRRETEHPTIELSEVWFKYGKDLPDVVKGLNFKAYAGEIAAILGGNGTGKTTTLSLIAELNSPYRGAITVGEGVVSLPQNPQALFIKKTVREDLAEMLSRAKLPKQEKQERIAAVAALCELETLMDSHPYDLSGGEQQRAALAKILLLRPKILLLDEPTKGLDAEFKQTFSGILRSLANEGVTVLMVSHDIEFCAEYADRCALFFDGAIVSEDAPREFFTGNSFYTTAANRMARHILPDAVTAADIIRAIGGKPRKLQPKQKTAHGIYQADAECETQSANGSKFPLWRIITAAASGVGLLIALIFAFLNGGEMLDFLSGGDLAINVAADPAKLWKYVSLIAAVAVFAAAFMWAVNRAEPEIAIQTPKDKRKLSKRTLAAAVMILVAIPLTVYVGTVYFGDRKYYFISILVILETLLPFTLVFESRKPQARELITIAVLCAITVAGRAAFFMLPQFKPVVAMVIIAGVAFGGEAGFLVGAMSGFVSNMFFGQGPWTSYQMFAFGVIGFLAGVLFRKGFLRRNTAALCIFGGLATFFIYGGIMNPASVLMFQSHPTAEMFYLTYLQGIPFDLVHAVATIIFLLFIAKPMLEKLDRIKVKYGLVE